MQIRINLEIRQRFTHAKMKFVGWHISTYEWHTNDRWVHTDNIRAHTSDLRMTYEWYTSTYDVHTNGMRMTYEWQGNDVRNTKFYKGIGAFRL